ncbi:MAG: hypothetical protein H7Y60_05625, partial [Rhodospirillaceae bacterium]|nr:hypothetical protein [Rhodospirillales bacterium]
MSHQSPHPPRFRPVAADRPLALWREPTGWRVTAGFLDLFAVPVQDGEPAGRRVFLARQGIGQVVLPLPLAEDWGVLACGGQDSVVCDLDAAPSAEDVDGWLAILGEAVSGDGAAAAGRALGEGHHALAEGENSVAARQPLWVRVLSGAVLWGDDHDPVTPETPPLPLCAGLRLNAGQPAEIVAVRSRDLMAEGNLETALAAAHHRLVAAIIRTTSHRQEMLARSIADRTRQSRRMMEAGYDTLARTITPGRPVPQPPATG